MECNGLLVFIAGCFALSSVLMAMGQAVDLKALEAWVTALREDRNAAFQYIKALESEIETMNLYIEELKQDVKTLRKGS